MGPQDRSLSQNKLRGRGLCGTASRLRIGLCVGLLLRTEPLEQGFKPGEVALLDHHRLFHAPAQDLVKAIARAFRWRKLLETGVHITVGEIAAAEKINPSYVSRVLRLTLLAPEIVEAILDGRQESDVTLATLLESFPVAWKEQRMIA